MNRSVEAAREVLSGPILRWAQAAWAVPTAIFLGGLLVGVFRAGSKSIWHDEGVTTWFIDQPFDVMFRTLQTYDANNALYYFLLKSWTLVAGTSEAMLRLPSALTMSAAAVALYWGVRALCDRRTAIVAAALFVTAPFVVEYMQQARGYGLTVLLVTTAFLATVRGNRLLFVVSGALAIYGHVWSGLAIGAMLLWILPVHPGRAVASGVAILALSMPLLLFGLQAPGPAWIGPITLETMTRAFLGLAGQVWPLIPLVVLASIIAAWARDRRRTLFLLWGWVPILGLLAVSAVRPMLVDRYLLVTLPAMASLVAMLATSFGRRGVPVVAALLALQLIGTVGWYQAGPAQDVRGTAAQIAHRGADGDAIIYFPAVTRFEMEYYLARFGPDLVEVPIDGLRDAGDHATVWVVMNYPYTGQTPPALAQLFADLKDRGYAPRMTERVNGMALARFVRMVAAPTAYPPDR